MVIKIRFGHFDIENSYCEEICTHLSVITRRLIMVEINRMFFWLMLLLWPIIKIANEQGKSQWNRIESYVAQYRLFY